MKDMQKHLEQLRIQIAECKISCRHTAGIDCTIVLSMPAHRTFASDDAEVVGRATLGA